MRMRAGEDSAHFRSSLWRLDYNLWLGSLPFRSRYWLPYPKQKMRSDTCQHQAVDPRFAAAERVTKKLLSSESVTPLHRLKQSAPASRESCNAWRSILPGSRY